MYKKYQFIKTSTAGNRTGYIVGEDAYQNRDDIMQLILRKKNLEAEQYAFLWRNRNTCVMNMAGGELCGGAVLASPVILDRFTGETSVRTVDMNLESVVTNRDKNKIYVQTELPISAFISKSELKKAKSLEDVVGYQVDLEGISYFVTDEEPSVDLDLDTFTKLDKELGTQKISAIGVILITGSGRMKPIVWVKPLDTITEEQGCTTGTISAQACFPTASGWWKQPSGESIRAKISPGVKIEIESSVERLSDGTVYLNDE